MTPTADLPHDKYEEAIRSRSAEPPAGFAATPAGAYRRQAGGFVPEPRPGCAVLANPYPITSLAEETASIQDQLCEACPGFAAVPIATLHLTVAELIARQAYAGLVAGEREKYCAAAARICAAWRFPPGSAGTIAGLGVFPSVVVALVSFTPAAYQALMTVREAIHAELGLSPPWPFIGHLTLGYVEISASAPAVQRERAENAVGTARRALAQRTPGTFGLDRPAVFTFPHMSRFDPW